MQMYLWNPSDYSVEIASVPTYDAVPALFGPSPTGGLTEEVVVAIDGTAPTSDGCEPLTNGGAISGKIALIDRGLCDFVVKVQNAQTAGAIGVIVANNVLAAISGMADNGNGHNITIPSMFISLSDGDALKGLVPVTATLRATNLMKDGDVDSDIIWHEYGHGLTWRMIGNMSGAMSGAIGEGMSDVLAILINGNDVVGEYSTDDPGGIRSAPYTGYPRTYGNFQSTLGVHRNGEIYAAAVWRVWELFKLAGVPQDDLFDYLIDGMNYTPMGPTMEAMRDGILQAAARSGDVCLIWAGFAELGIGVDAEGTSSSVVTESFDVPGSCTGSNNVPAANPDSLTVAKGGSQTGLDSGQGSVLANDIDSDGPLGLTAVWATGPSNGVLTLNGEGTFSYTHDGSDTLSDSFTYRAYDGVDYSSAATVSITVTEAGAEVVAITKATYNSKKDKLDVEATSSAAPDATLALYVFGDGTEAFTSVPMIFNPKKAKYSASITAPDEVPTSVKVTSSAGGEATADLGGGGGGGGSCNGKGNKPGCPLASR
jgi:VCBS repeat-containing protein